MTTDLSPRQQIAQRFSERMRRPVLRLEHGKARRSTYGKNAKKRKHYYLVADEKNQTVVEVFGEAYIVVNGYVCRNEDKAFEHLDQVLRNH